MSPRQTSHQDSALFICSRRSARSARADHRDDCGPVPQSPPASLPAASLPVQYENTPPALQRYSHTADTAPLRRSHHEAARLRRHTAGCVPESLILSVSLDLLRKFVNGKEPPKLATMRASHTRACTCCICPYGYRWWVYRTHPPPQDRDNRIHLPGNPTYRCSPA